MKNEKVKTRAMVLAFCMALLVAMSGVVSAQNDNTKADGTSVLPLRASTEAIKAPGDVISSFSAQGNTPRGITYDGTYLWTTDADSDTIYKINPATGSVVTSFASPGSFPADLAWDGTYLWNTDPGTDTIYKINPITGLVVASFASQGSVPNGLCWDGQYLWNADAGTHTIYKINPTTGSVVTSFASPATGLVYGLAWDGASLLHADYYGSKIYKINPGTGTVELMINTPSSNPAGVAWDGQYAWYVDGGERMVYQIDVGYEPEEPSVSISIDSFEYCPGDTMTVTLDIANPTEESVTFQWYWVVPQFSVCVPVMSAPIPAGYDDTFDFSFTIPDWGSTPFGNVFYVQLLDEDDEILDADAACWAYSPSGKAIPAAEVDIAKEIKKTIERVE